LISSLSLTKDRIEHGEMGRVRIDIDCEPEITIPSNIRPTPFAVSGHMLKSSSTTGIESAKTLPLEAREPSNLLRIEYQNHPNCMI
jgi:hypothetical protein